MVTGDPGHAYPQGWNLTGDFSSRVSMYGNLIHLVIPARIELATYRLGGGCSILLSYGTITTAQAKLKPFYPSCIKYYTAKTKYWQ